MTDDSWGHFQNMLGNIAAATGYKLPEARTSLYWAVLQHKIPDDDFMSRLAKHIIETTGKFPTLPEILSYPEFRTYTPPAVAMAQWVKDVCSNTACRGGYVFQKGRAFRCPSCQVAPEWLRIVPGTITKKGDEEMLDETTERKELVLQTPEAEHVKEALTALGVVL
jgi:hypothetical protein